MTFSGEYRRYRARSKSIAESIGAGFYALAVTRRKPYPHWTHPVHPVWFWIWLKWGVMCRACKV